MANQFEMHTLHSPPTSPQQNAGAFEFQPVTSGAEYTHQQTHPALSPPYTTAGPSAAGPSTLNTATSNSNNPYGPEPPYSSQPSSPGTAKPPQHTTDFFTATGGMMNFPPPPTSSSPGPASQQQQQLQQFPLPPTGNVENHNPAAGGQFEQPPPPGPPKTPVYTPGGMAGPNGAGVHAPGQIAHPNQHSVGREKYKHTKWACFSEMGICCTGFWCPCILYSRTYHRIKTIPNSNLNDFSACNAHCCGFCVLAPVSWVFTLLQRTRIRENYRLEGSVGGDCITAYCCSCCTLIQDEREVRDREDERRKFAGPGNGAVGSVEGYKKPDGMEYGR